MILNWLETRILENRNDKHKSARQLKLAKIKIVLICGTITFRRPLAKSVDIFECYECGEVEKYPTMLRIVPHNKEPCGPKC